MSTNSPGRILAAARDRAEFMFRMSRLIALVRVHPDLEAEVTVDGDPLPDLLERLAEADRQREDAA